MEYLPAKTLVTRTRNQEWFGVDYNMNIYRGCSFGCIYCDSRSLCYQIEQFDAICAKKDALDIIRNDLLKKRRRGVIATGAMSDPYNPGERYNCASFYAGKLWKIFCAECTKQGLHFNMQEIITGYKQKYAVEQLSLF